MANFDIKLDIFDDDQILSDSDSDHDETGIDLEAALNISGESSYHLVDPVGSSMSTAPEASASSLLTNCSLLYLPKIVSLRIGGGYANISSLNPTNDEMLSRDTLPRGFRAILQDAVVVVEGKYRNVVDHSDTFVKQGTGFFITPYHCLTAHHTIEKLVHRPPLSSSYSGSPQNPSSTLPTSTPSNLTAATYERYAVFVNKTVSCTVMFNDGIDAVVDVHSSTSSESLFHSFHRSSIDLNILQIQLGWTADHFFVPAPVTDLDCSSFNQVKYPCKIICPTLAPPKSESEYNRKKLPSQPDYQFLLELYEQKGGPFISFGTLAESHTSGQNSTVASSPSRKKRRNGKSSSKESFTRHKEYNILREHLVSTEASVSGAPLITTPHNWLTLSSSKPCSTRIQSYEILRFNGVHIGALSHLEPATDAMVTLGQRKGIIFQQCRLNYYIPTDSAPFAFVFLSALQKLVDRDNDRSVSSYYDSQNDFDAVLEFVNTLECLHKSPRSQSLDVSRIICGIIEAIRAQMH